MTLDRNQGEPSATKLFGWHGITCRIPEDWDLVSLNGTQRSGYFAFDDERTRRLEIKYQQARRWGQPALEKTLEFYFDSVRKKLKKGTEFEVDYDAKLTGLELIPEDVDYRSYGWTSELIARGIIRLCGKCRRVVIAQCLSRPNRLSVREMSDVLVSIGCHAEDEHSTWAVFDFSVGVPDRLMLESNNLRAGLISLTFSGRKERLVIDRIGMANAVLKQTAMDDYIERIHYKKLRRRRLRFTEDQWLGHDGFQIDGERSRLMYLLPAVGPFLRQLRKSDHVAGRAWVCDEANRMFVVRAEGKESKDLVEEVASSIACHGNAGSYIQ
jgi:hypothetical protein